MFKYTVVIRTLGKAGVYYKKTLDSILQQTIMPSNILVYIAEGYPLPLETINIEKYVYVKKGMVAQRALKYDEVKTEYILFLDDDVYLPPTGVETLYDELSKYNGNVISPYVFHNHDKSFKEKIRLTLFGREVCRLFGKRWGLKVLPTAGFSYINNPKKGVYESQTNAGPCFLCKKEDFLKIKYEDELWLDETPYAFPDDQVMFYKMYLKGLKVLTSYDSCIVHLDAGSTTVNSNKTLKVIYSEYRNKLIFWYRFIYSNERNYILKIWKIFCIFYVYFLQTINACYKVLIGKKDESNSFFKATRDGLKFIMDKKNDLC